MPVDFLGNIQVESPITITHATASSVTVPSQANEMHVSCPDAVNLRFTETGNNFRIPPDDTYRLDVSSLRGKTLWFYNPAGSGSTVVSVLFVTRSAI